MLTDGVSILLTLHKYFHVFNTIFFDGGPELLSPEYPGCHSTHTRMVFAYSLV